MIYSEKMGKFWYNFYTGILIVYCEKYSWPGENLGEKYLIPPICSLKHENIETCMYCLIDVFLVHVTRFEIEGMKFIVYIGKVIPID